MQSLQGKVLPVVSLAPVSVTSDGANGAWVDYNGWNRALIICHAGLVATGDSDDTMTFLVQKSAIAAASAAASDVVDITAATQTVGASASTDVALGAEFIDLDFRIHSLTTGALRVSATASEGCAAASAATIILYDRNGTLSDTAMTIATPASS